MSWHSVAEGKLFSSMRLVWPLEKETGSIITALLFALTGMELHWHWCHCCEVWKQAERPASERQEGELWRGEAVLTTMTWRSVVEGDITHIRFRVGMKMFAWVSRTDCKWDFPSTYETSSFLSGKSFSCLLASDQQVNKAVSPPACVLSQAVKEKDATTGEESNLSVFLQRQEFDLGLSAFQSHPV